MELQIISQISKQFGMDGLIEEHLNAYSSYKMKRTDFEDTGTLQLDLMIPIREK